ncbi:MAG: hypothetical protein OQK99_08030 [Gammaproteobacteria bacterium]|jgi:hypothetical protein|nr:hypothetical protein [Gammaproteobacteria bacterium]
MHTHQNDTTGFKPSIRSLVAAIAILFLSGIPVAMAASGESSEADEFHNFGISLGVFVTNRDSTTRLDGDIPNSGTPIDLETDLGLSKQDSVFRIDGYYRFNEKHRIDFSYFDLSRDGSKVLNRTIDFLGEEFLINTQVDANFDMSIYKIAYTYSVIQNDSGYLGLSAGLYIADISAGISLTPLEGGLIDGAAASEGVTAPLPVFGVRGQYNFTEKWMFRGSAEIFVYEYDAYSGSLYDVYAGIDYQWFKNMAVGIGYNSVKLDVGVSADRFEGNLNWQYDGGLLFFKFEF